MKEFKIRKIEDKEHCFSVEIEFFVDGERRRFVFPYGDNWQKDNEDGEPRFVAHIRKILKQEEKKADEQEKLQAIEQKLKGKDISIIQKIKKNK